MNKKFFGVLAAILVVALIGSCQGVTDPDIGGASGVPAGAQLSASAVKAYPNATLITDQAGLAAINNDPAGTYVLGASFAVTDWVPICNPTSQILPANPFSGILAGNGYTITIDSFDSGAVSSEYFLGIFAISEGALFTDLTVDIAAGAVGPASAQYVGGLVAAVIGTTFNGITVTGALDVSVATGDDFNVGLVTGYALEGSTFTGTTVSADLAVQYSNVTTTTTSVNAGGITGGIADSTLIDANIDGRFTVKANMPYYYDPTPGNGAALGGAAGYAENTDFDSVTVGLRTTVSAVSAQSPVFIGGVVGRGLAISIERNKSAAVVSGDGPNYNTSGGGVGGYLVHSTVTDSSASGGITLNATWDGGEYNLWQIYAGGLIGYSGGNLDGNSVITQSHATGNVTATSPYPYAGGLVGYNYGYSVFSSPEARRQSYYDKSVTATTTYNGSVITNSYATGSATATSTLGSNGLPYAGGLAAYSSIPTASRDPNIEKSYATGNATVTTDSKYGWAGGLLGGNAQGSLVVNSYASGDVFVTVGSNELPYPQDGINPGAAGGGIVGVNYFTDVTSGLTAVIQDSVAFNGHITGSAPTGVPYLLHRVAGDLGDPAFGEGILIDNDGRNGMDITPVWTPEIGPDLRDGASFGTDGYPALR
jgi:hypothetical protein